MSFASSILGLFSFAMRGTGSSQAQAAAAESQLLAAAASGPIVLGADGELAVTLADGSIVRIQGSRAIAEALAGEGDLAARLAAAPALLDRLIALLGVADDAGPAVEAARQVLLALRDPDETPEGEAGSLESTAGEGTLLVPLSRESDNDPRLAPGQGEVRAASPFEAGFIGNGVGHLPGLPGESLIGVDNLTIDNVGVVSQFQTLAAFESAIAGGTAEIGDAVDHLVPLGNSDYPTGDDDDQHTTGHNDHSPILVAEIEDDLFRMLEDGTFSGDLKGNDDLPHGSKGFSLLSPPADGTLVLTKDGTFTYTPPAHFSGEVTFTYRYKDPLTGQIHKGTATIEVAAIADPVTHAGGTVTDEDVAVPVPVTIDLIDRDGSESLESVVVSGVPAGATFGWDHGLGGSVTSLGGGSFRFTGSTSEIQALLQSLEITPPLHSDADITLHVTAVTRDSNPPQFGGIAPGRERATTEFDVTVKVLAVADVPQVTTPADPWRTDEDVRVALTGPGNSNGAGLGGALVDAADGSETLSYRITGAPDGAGFENAAGGSVGSFDAGTGVWSFTKAELEGGLYFVPPLDAVSPPGGYAMVLISVATEGALDSADPALDQVTLKEATNARPFTIIVDPIADVATITGSTGTNEDTPVNFGADISITETDTDGSEHLVEVTIRVPAGANIIDDAGTPGVIEGIAYTASGSAVVSYDPGTRTYTVTSSNPDLAAAEAEIRATIASFTLDPSLHGDADIDLAITATMRDGTHETTTPEATHTVAVHAVADAPTGHGGTVTDEDTLVAVPITVELTDQDGSESLTFVLVEGVPAGATLGWDTGLPGTVEDLGGGKFRFTGSTTEIQALLQSLTIDPPYNSDADITLHVTAQTRETNPTEVGDVLAGSATANLEFDVEVKVMAVADTPGVTTPDTPYRTNEDTRVELTGLGGALNDTDGSETLSYRITGAPTGASFETAAGDPVGSFDAGSGVWSFTRAELEAGLWFEPPLDAATPPGGYTMNLVSVAIEGALDSADPALDQVTLVAATNTKPFAIIVDPIADVASISGSTSTNEDTPVNFGGNFSITETDTDGSEHLVGVTIRVPAGANVTDDAGTPNAIEGISFTVNGFAVVSYDPGTRTYTVTSPNPDLAAAESEIRATIASFAVSPSLHGDADIEFAITATMRDGTHETTTPEATHTVAVHAVADAITGHGGTVTDEDTLVAVPITVSLTDTDSSESLTSVLVEGVPSGATLGWNLALPGTVEDLGGGSFRFTGATAEIQGLLQSLTIDPPHDSDADITLHVTAASGETDPTEPGDVLAGSATASLEFDVAVKVKAVADVPGVTTPDTPYHTSEDARVELTGLGGALADIDGSESLSYRITGAPAGAAFETAAGAPVGSYDAGTDTWSFSRAELEAGLWFQPPTDYSTPAGSLVMNLISVSTEGAIDSGDPALDQVTLQEATNTKPFSIVIDPVVDAPTVTGSSTTNEDTPVNFGANIAIGETDTDGSEHVVKVTIRVPAGANVSDDAGTPNAIEGISYTPSGSAAVSYDPGTRTYTVTSTNPDLDAAEAEIRATIASFTLTPSRDSDADFDLGIAVTMNDGGVEATTPETPHTITVNPIADMPTIGGSTSTNEDTLVNFGGNIAIAETDIDGSEHLIEVTVRVPAGADVIDNVGTPAVIEGIAYTPAGSAVVVFDTGTRTYTVTSTNPDLDAAEAEIRATLASFTLNPSLHGDADIDLAITATMRDGTNEITTPEIIHTLAIHAVADAPTGYGGTVTDEDTLVVVPITVALTDIDGSETLTFVRVDGVPTGATLGWDTGLAGTVENLGGGSFRFTGSTPEIQALLQSLTIDPPYNSDADITLHVTAQTKETNPTEGGDVLAGSETATLEFDVTVKVMAVADTPDVTTPGTPYHTIEDTRVELTGLGGALNDTDGSETLSYRITGAPTGASFETAAGDPVGSFDAGSGVWSFSRAELEAGLWFQPPTDYSTPAGSLIMNLVSVATEGALDSSNPALDQVTLKEATNAKPISIVIDPIVDLPSILGATTINEDPGSPVTFGQNIIVAPSDSDGSEQIVEVAIRVPAGVNIVDNTGTPAIEGITYSTSGAAVVAFDSGTRTYTITSTNPNLTLAAADIQATLDTFRFTPVTHGDADFNVYVTATSDDGAVRNTTPEVAHHVDVKAVADRPTVSGSAITDEDTLVAVPITVSLVDTDGSETLSRVTVSGVPAGATFDWSHALPGTVTNLGSGSYRFTGTTAEIQALLLTITINPPANSDADITLAVAAVSTETNPTEVGDVATLNATRNFNVVVKVMAVADTPNVGTPAAPWIADEDVRVQLSGVGVTNGTGLTGALNDTDGSETLTYTITGAPAGASFQNAAGASVGTLVAGAWTFTAAQLTSGLFFVPPADAVSPPGGYSMVLTSIATEGALDSSNPLLDQVTLKTASNSSPFTIVVNAKADFASISGSTTIDEDNLANFGSQVIVSQTDDDGSETITQVTIKVPAGANVVDDAGTAGVIEGISYALSGDAVVSFDSATRTYTITSTNPDAAQAEADIQATLDSFTLTPLQHDDSNVTLAVTATSTETSTGDSVTTAATDHVIVVKAVADAPAIDASGVGVEDTRFALNLEAHLVDTDGSESISARLLGIPHEWDVYWVATGGTVTRAPDGTVTITAPTEAALNTILASFEVKAPTHVSGEFSFTLEATATEAATGGELTTATAVSTKPFTVVIEAVADQPPIITSASEGGRAGYEDTPIKLYFNALLVDKDSTETLHIDIGDVPLGATFTNSAGAPVGITFVDPGTGETIWRFTPAEHADLHVLAPLHSNEDFVLKVRATTIEDNTIPGLPGEGDEASSGWQNVPVQVIGIADRPNLIIADLHTPEDQPIPLGSIILGSLVDADGSETLSYVISGLPAGVVPSHGEYIGNGEWQVSSSEIALLTIAAPANFSGDWDATYASDLKVRAVTQENDGSQTFVEADIDGITIRPVADGFDGWSPALTAHPEDSDIPLSVVVFGGGLNDADGSEQIVNYTLDLSGMIAAAQIAGVVGDAAAFISTFIKGGSFTDNGDGTITATRAELLALSLDKAAFLDSNVDFSIPVSALVRDTAGVLTDDRIETATFTIDLKGVADTPTVFAGDAGNDPADADYSGGSFTLIDVNVHPFGGETTDTDDGLGRADSESIYYIVSGLKDNPDLRLNFVDSAGNIVGSNNGDGTWYLSQADLADLHITGRAWGDPLIAESVELTLTTVATENDGDIATSAAPFRVDILPPGGGGGIAIDPLPPILTIGPMIVAEDLDTNLDGTTDAGEANSGKLTLNISAVKDPADGTNPSITVILSSLPSGIVVEGAIYNPVTGQLFASAASLAAGLVKITPPADFSGELTFTAVAVATNLHFREAESAPQTGTIDVTPSADPLAITITPVDVVDGAGLDEDHGIALNLSLAITDPNGTLTEQIQGPVTIRVPAGTSLAGDTSGGGGLAHAGNVYTITGTAAQIAVIAASLVLTPPAHAHGTLAIEVSGLAVEPGNGDTHLTTSTFTVTLAADADAPSITVPDSGSAAPDVTGAEDSWIAFPGLSVALVDTDGSELLSAKISGIPEDAILSAGSNNGDGSWTVPIGSLATLLILPPPHYSGTMTLTLEAFSVEKSNGDSAATALSFDVEVTPVADTVSIYPRDVIGEEDGAAVVLDLGILLEDRTGLLAGENPGESVEITFDNLPAGGTLNLPTGGAAVFNGFGQWVFSGTAAQANALTFSPAANWSGLIAATFAAVAIDNGVRGVATAGAFEIRIDPVADAPGLLVNDASGLAGTAIPINILAGLTDTDGSESLTIIVTDVPAGGIFSAGYSPIDGYWYLTPAQLAGLTFTPAAGESGTIHMSVTAFAQDFMATGIVPTPDYATDIAVSGPLGLDIEIGTGGVAISGDSSGNVLTGGIGNDTIDGGAGADTLTGGVGDDTYIVDDAGDSITENFGEGTDLVSSSVDIWLNPNLENLELMAAAVFGGGNALANAITGNAVANTLLGGGGDDTLLGGDGDDTLAGGTGIDLLSGGIGADVLTWAAGDEVDGPDVVSDFVLGPGGDVIDLSDLLPGYVEGTSAIGDFVQATTDGTSTTLRIDQSGTGNFAGGADVVTLSHVVETDPEVLKAQGNLIA